MARVCTHIASDNVRQVTSVSWLIARCGIRQVTKVFTVCQVTIVSKWRVTKVLDARLQVIDQSVKVNNCRTIYELVV